MAFSVSPSVIVREVDASQAVPAVATPPAAMAGIFRWGPVNEPILITSENDLVNRFGKPDDSNFETFFTAADYLAYSNALYIVRADDGTERATAFVSDITYDANGAIVSDDSFYNAFEALYPGSLGENLDVSWTVNSAFGGDWVAEGDIAALAYSDANTAQEIAFYSESMHFEVAAVNKLTPLTIGDTLRIGNDNVGYQELKIASFTETAIKEPLTGANTDPLATDDDVIIIYEYDIAFTSKYTLPEKSLNNLSMESKWLYSSAFGKSPTTAAGVSNIHVAVIDRTGAISGTAGAVIERFENLSIDPSATLPQGTTNYYANVIENMSSWIKVANSAVVTAAAEGNPLSSGVTIAGQREVFTGAGTSATESNATLANLGFAWDTLKNGNEIDISLVLQGKGDNEGIRANYILSNLVDDRKDCVLYLSPSREAAVDPAATYTKLSNIIAYRNKIQNSSYAFMDSGYKYRYDKYNDVYRWTPLNGDMAGLAARVEPWESPAGYRKGVIKNIIKLAFNPNKAQRDQLYSADINPVMSQVGHGIVLFGDKTLLGLPSAFDRINVRRLFIAVEKSIATAAESFLFEFNDEFTQTQFRNIVEPFLRDIQGRRGIIDFRVVSDSTVNTAEIIDQNKFRANIFIKPARSINVIELTFVATRTGVEFDEIVGQIA